MSTTTTKASFNKPVEHLTTPVHPAWPVLTSFLGTWVNVNTATRDLVRMVLSETAGALHVHAFGACTPTPCDWGNIAGHSYTASVSGGPAVAFSAHYTFGFKTTILTGHLDGAHLVVEDFNIFTDHSGRSAYFSQGTFRKA